VSWFCTVLAVVLAAAADAPAPARPFATPSDLISVNSSLDQTQRFVLPNGLTAILAPDAEMPVVGMELSYEVGVRDEPDQRPGLAAVVQRLMQHATRHVGPGDYERLLQEVGGRWQSVTNLDRTFFEATVPSQAIALPLWLWSDQMGFLAETLTDAGVAQQIAELDDSYVRRFENVPLGHLWQTTNQAIFPAGHPHHNGNPRPAQAMRGLTAAEVRQFIARNYTPGRARLVLSGAFNPTQARRLIAQYFASLPAGAAAPRRTAEPPVLRGETRLHLAAHVELPAVTVAWSTSPDFQPKDAALDTVAELLTGDRAGLLRIKLVDQLRIATEVSAEQESHRLGSTFVIKATAAPGHTSAELLAGIDGVLRDAVSRPPTQYFFVGAVAGYVLDHVFTLQTHALRASQYAHCDEHGVTQRCVGTVLDRYLRLVPGDLSRAIAAQLPLDRRVVIEVVPSPDAPIAGEVRDGAP
jgi:zinc protease